MVQGIAFFGPVEGNPLHALQRLVNNDDGITVLTIALDGLFPGAVNIGFFSHGCISWLI